MTPDISIIIPTFRRPKELSEAIGSVLGQNGVRVELFVVDDSPEGSAREVVEGVNDKRVSYVHNPHPTGGVPSIVRNLALPLATARLVHFLDDDDIVPDGHYGRALARFAMRPDVGLVFGPIQPFGNGPESQLAAERKFFAEATRIASLCRKTGSRLAFVSSQLFRHALLVCSAGIVRRECVTAIGGFDPSLRIMEDADFYTFIMRHFAVDFIDDVTLHYRISSKQSLMHTASPSEELIAATKENLRTARTITLGKYRAEFGLHELLLLKLFARTVLSLL
jgi:glycosyltransferase involved in cell wall biosynthesis